jgi:spore maturation protein CgeB
MSVNAVFAGDLWHGATLQGLAHGFRSLGWLIDEVDVNRFFRSGGGRLTRAVERLLAPANRADFNHAILASARRHQARLLVTVKGNYIAPTTLAQLRAEGVRSVNFYPDVEFEHGGIDRTMLAAYDLVASTKSYHFPYLTEALGVDRAAFVHHGYSSLVHRPLRAPQDEADYDRDLLYVGNYAPAKLDWLLQVAAAHPQRSLLVVGNNWAAPARGTALEPFIHGHAVVGDHYAAMIGASRINVALHHGPVRTPGWEDQVSTRSFEIPACGGFMLHIDNAEVRSLFDAPREMDVFSTPAELNAKIAHYLARPEERRAAAARGHARAVPAYSLDARARELADLLRI